ncbi:MAG: 3-dehydroquinate synthase, partial [Fusobacteriaceae bacterium]
WIRDNLKVLENFKDKNFILVGVAATVTTQATVYKKMESYDRSKLHLKKLSIDIIKENLNLFLSSSEVERKNIAGLEPKRSGVIIGGTIILLQIMEILNCDSLILSEVDNLEGAIITY